MGDRWGLLRIKNIDSTICGNTFSPRVCALKCVRTFAWAHLHLCVCAPKCSPLCECVRVCKCNCLWQPQCSYFLMHFWVMITIAQSAPFQWLIYLTVEMGIIVQKRFSITTKNPLQLYSWSSFGPELCYCQQPKLCFRVRLSSPDSSGPMNLQYLVEMKRYAIRRQITDNIPLTNNTIHYSVLFTLLTCHPSDIKLTD